jgi:glucan 1,3-beta-glucosidase
MVFTSKLTTSVVAAVALLSQVSNGAPAMMEKVKRDLPFKFGQDKVRGVNLGGWLVLEPWITPSIFEATPDNVVDGEFIARSRSATVVTNSFAEYTYGAQYGWNTDRLNNHWDTWITEDDFKEMASMGLNTARLPSKYRKAFEPAVHG